MTDWVRLWHDMPTDPKWRVVARKSGQPLSCVIAVFNLMMVNASMNADERGTLLNWDDEDAAAGLDMEADAVSAIRSAMQGKVIDNERLSGWEKRQPKREDSSAARVAKHRASLGNDMKRDVTQGNAPEAEPETELAKASRASPSIDVPSLMLSLCKAAGIMPPDPGCNFARHSEWLKLVADWLEAGADPAEMEKRLAASPGKARTLRYFDAAVRETIMAKQASASESDQLIAKIRAGKSKIEGIAA